MSLKAILASKAEVEALPEAVRALYKESDGKFVLDVEGGFTPAAEVLDLKTKLAEFRDNNRTMHTELEKLRPLAAKFEGVDPDEYKTLKAEMSEMKAKGIKGLDDINKVVADAVAKATKPITDALEAEKKTREAAEKTASDGKFRELVSAEATKAGVKPNGVRHVLREAESVFTLKDGVLAPKDGVKHPTDPLRELSPSEWLLGLAKTDDYLFETSNGGGAPGGGAPGGGGPKPGAKRLINPSPEEMGTHMEAIAKGEMIVVRQ